VTARPPSRFASEWAGLRETRPSTETSLRVRELAAETAWGRLALGIDIDSSRHLLVPIASNARVRSGLDGPGLSLRRRALEDASTYTMYADLSCHRTELGYLFDDLCADVLTELKGFERQPLRALYQVVDRWRSLFDRPLGALSDDSAKGLFAELVVLRRLLAVDPGAHELWTGPSRSGHDFKGRGVDIEVKSTTVAAGRMVRVHGLDQLEPTKDSTLLLAWFRLVDGRQSGAGESLEEVAAQALAMADDEPAVRQRMGAAGYIPGTLPMNDDRRYTIADERWYAVDDTFPRLTRATLDQAGAPETVIDVDYTVDLTAEPPIPMQPPEIARWISTIGGAS
jgi:hypothetical protein